jgi:hypothetical protein
MLDSLEDVDSIPKYKLMELIKKAINS